MNIIEILRADYKQFPLNQTYDIYADDVYFQDPMNKFRGIKRYQQMIQFIQTWFSNPQLDLHGIQKIEDTIKTEWTLSWTTPLPWQPRISIPGWSELRLNSQGLINSHIDYWHISRLDVVKQHFSR
ncbi:DUF2358 domain-containing protein [Calothrix sp. 336/3]|uniref:DUF2358 domain-containing protein n=1 Tax=Calothrix sp. 336/3 TaxID=1337936 RepID=UPI0004E30E65|nr:DUF2358 domain-containing protein [Calothrix sp. 336/3]AKG21773.1 hypothetical protein IJ00_11350 [Calothrix sp. 336/3]